MIRFDFSSVLSYVFLIKNKLKQILFFQEAMNFQWSIFISILVLKMGIPKALKIDL